MFRNKIGDISQEGDQEGEVLGENGRGFAVFNLEGGDVSVRVDIAEGNPRG